MTRILGLALLWICGSGCAGLGYTGSAHDLAPQALRKERGWVGALDVPLYEQSGRHDCGAAALAMVARYWDPSLPVAHLLEQAEDRRLSAGELRSMARELGFRAFVVEGTVQDLVHEVQAGRPVIVGVAKPTLEGHVAHYEVVVGFHPATQTIATLDPAEGHRANSYAGFLEEWVPTGNVLIVVLPGAVEPPPTCLEQACTGVSSRHEAGPDAGFGSARNHYEVMNGTRLAPRLWPLQLGRPRGRNDPQYRSGREPS